MNHEEARRLLDRIGVLKHSCDLDLLVFFARHHRAIVTSEQLAVWLGYELKQIAESLDTLLGAGLLTRTQNPAHAARMYVFVGGSSGDDWVPTLLKFVSTRDGRLAVREELSRRAPKDPKGRVARQTPALSPPRPFVVRHPSDGLSGTKTG